MDCVWVVEAFIESPLPLSELPFVVSPDKCSPYPVINFWGTASIPVLYSSHFLIIDSWHCVARWLALLPHSKKELGLNLKHNLRSFCVFMFFCFRYVGFFWCFSLPQAKDMHAKTWVSWLLGHTVGVNVSVGIIVSKYYYRDPSKSDGIGS